MVLVYNQVRQDGAGNKFDVVPLSSHGGGIIKNIMK